MRSSFLPLAVGLALLAMPARSDEPSTKDAKAPVSAEGAQDDPARDPALDALFGDALKPSGDLGELKKATEGLEGGTDADGLRPKTEILDLDAKVSFLEAFAAKRIVLSRKEGCIPAGYERKKVTFIEVLELPAKTPAFSLCLKMRSKVGRPMRLTAAIVDVRNRRVAKAEGVADFTGKPRLDYIFDFSPVGLTLPGPYQVVVDLEGKPAARLALFEVKRIE